MVVSVKWQEKMLHLLGSKNAAALSRSVGLHESAISNAVNSGKMPGVDKAIKIARAFGVPTDWLFDDSKDFPPPRMEMPPVSIMPWPPHGISWQEVADAINNYVAERTRRGLKRLEAESRAKGKDVTFLCGQDLETSWAKADKLGGGSGKGGGESG